MLSSNDRGDEVLLGSILSLEVVNESEEFKYILLLPGSLNPILPGGGGGKICPLLFFLHHPKTAQGIKLKLSDFKDTPL